ncbi:UDP-N-acetyl-D-mannosaminuronic acid transferase [Stappia taiwanensis]|nr:WecB/TagA/CpsF family glycosyltransferase [Stappia taiwanensis]GGE89187.1 UDP-N-acetyl-D-mannosaminuronic acid transferase [Stappia taiwanensis]
MADATLTDPMTTSSHARIGPVAISRQTRSEAIAMLLDCMAARTKINVAFANAHGLLLAMDDPEFAETLTRCHVLNDGIGARIGARVLTGEGFAENLNGTDFVPALLNAAPAGTRVYLLGARPDVVARAADAFALSHPHVTICGWRDGYFQDGDRADIVAAINAAKADILLVALGNPKQELLMNALRAELDPPVVLGVGALFDFTAGEVIRAPKLMRQAGLEWVFRLLHEPKRLYKRYTSGVVRFLWKILLLRFSKRQAS